MKPHSLALAILLSALAMTVIVGPIVALAAVIALAGIFGSF